MSLGFGAVTFDCQDAKAQAAFWGLALGRSVGADSTEDFASLDGNPVLYFQKVPETKICKNRVHVDLRTRDLQGEVGRLESLGAMGLHLVEGGIGTWMVMTDPEGNEFDVLLDPSYALDDED
jgi:Glyoxalase-like domain